MKDKMVFTLVLSSLLSPAAVGSVVEITDREEWEAAVGAFTTIDFVLPPTGTLITDQYSSLGINFSGLTYSHETTAYLNDDWGLQADGGAWVHFDSPQQWLAMEFPGSIKVNLYHEDELIYESSAFWVAFTGRFAGLISEIEFDMAYFYRETNPNHAFIDDLHFGAIIPAPGALGLLALAGFFGSRRRRE